MENQSFTQQINELIKTSFGDDLYLLRKIENQLRRDEGKIETELIDGKYKSVRKTLNEVDLIESIINFIETYYINLPKIINESEKNLIEVSQEIKGIKIGEDENSVEINSNTLLNYQEIVPDINKLKELIALYKEKGEKNDNEK